MAISKNITLRLSERELAYFNELAMSKGLSRTDLIKKSVFTFGKKEEASTPIDKAAEVLQYNRNEPALNHPLVQRINKEGIKVVDDNGNTVVKITDLVQLLNFVNTKVFTNADS